MEGQQDSTGGVLRSPFPWIAFSAALALTAAAWFGLERSRLEEARQQFERRAENAASALRARLVTYEQILRAGAARMAPGENVSRGDWHRFIAHQQLGERFPGFQSVGYAEFVTRAAEAEHVRRMRTEIPDYNVRPATDRDERVVIVYNEPYAGRNARVIGFDMYSETVRRAAMDRARDSGETAITGRVTLAGEDFRGEQPLQPGFVMYVPIFHEGAGDLPRPTRRNVVSGFVFSPFRMHDLMRGIGEQGVLQLVDMRIYDEAQGSTGQAELIDTRTALRSPPVASAPPMFQRIVHFPVPGRAWTIHFASRPGFDAALRDDRPWIVLAGGALGSVVAFLLTTALIKAWNRAHHLSMRDPLTSLYNRRYLDETMPRELARAKRVGNNVGVIAIDLDHFKKLNDAHGHDVGDYVLARVGDLLRTATRGGDIACRLGGEEFAVILPGANLEATRTRAEAIRAAFAGMKYIYEGLEIGPFTLSAGVASISPAVQDWAAAFRLADRALYAAKQAGRNRVLTTADP